MRFIVAECKSILFVCENVQSIHVNTTYAENEKPFLLRSNIHLPANRPEFVLFRYFEKGGKKARNTAFAWEFDVK